MMENRRDVNSKTNGGSFIKRPKAVYESAAWQALPYFAQAILARIELEHMRNGGAKNGQLIVTLDDFAAYGFRRSSVPKAVTQCERLGFIEVTRGGFVKVGGVRRHPNKFRLTYVNDATGKLEATNEWERFDSAAKAKAALQGELDPVGNVVPFPKVQLPSFAVRKRA